VKFAREKGNKKAPVSRGFFIICFFRRNRRNIPTAAEAILITRVGVAQLVK
jgi:hypothetical protein